MSAPKRTPAQRENSDDSDEDYDALNSLLEQPERSATDDEEDNADGTDDAPINQRTPQNLYKNRHTSATTTDDNQNPIDPPVPAGWFMRHENGRSRLVRITDDPASMTDAESRA